MGLYLAVFDGDDEIAGVDVGPYEAFNQFRDCVIRELERGVVGARFPTLMNHSDCDGEWTVSDCAALRDELRTIAVELRERPPVPFTPTGSEKSLTSAASTPPVRSSRSSTWTASRSSIGCSSWSTWPCGTSSRSSSSRVSELARRSCCYQVTGWGPQRSTASSRRRMGCRRSRRSRSRSSPPRCPSTASSPPATSTIRSRGLTLHSSYRRGSPQRSPVWRLSWRREQPCGAPARGTVIVTRIIGKVVDTQEDAVEYAAAVATFTLLFEVDVLLWTSLLLSPTFAARPRRSHHDRPSRERRSPPTLAIQTERRLRSIHKTVRCGEGADRDPA